MILGVALHSSQVYNPKGTWVIYSKMGTPIATLLVDSIHLFRLPAFFIVSGFFFFVSYKKYGELKLLKLRGERLLVPLIFTAVTLNSVQAFLLDRSGWRPFDATRYLLGGGWLSHLWFLYYLFVYYLVLCLIIRCSAAVPAGITNCCKSFADRCHIVVILSLASLFQVVLLVVGKLVPVIYVSFSGITLYDLAFYLQFFIFGILLCKSKSLMDKFIHASPLYTIPLLVMGLALFPFLEDKGTLGVLLARYLSILSIWLSCSLCFYLFKKYADRPSKVMTFLASSSYSVYLFHHILVISFGLLFIEFGIGGLTGLVLLMAVAFALSAVLHSHFVSSSGILTYLFNGTRKQNAGKLATDTP